MAYCRWSSDSYRSDLYVFDHVNGTIQVWVASHRRVLEDDRVFPKPPDLDAPMSEWEKYAIEYRAFMHAMNDAELVPIGLSRDGERFSVDTHREAAELIRSLKAEGYHVPDGVIEEVEAAEDVAEELLDAYEIAWQARDWDEVERIQDLIQLADHD